MRDDAADGTSRHVASCPSCQQLVQELRTVVGLRRSTVSTNAAGPDCLDEVALTHLIEGAEQGTARDHAMAHLVSCGHCRRQLAALSGLLADPAIAAEMQRVASRPSVASGPRRRRLVLTGAMVAAAAVLLFVARPQGAGRDDDSHRGPTMTAGSTPRQLSPVGDVASVRSLRWTAVPGADRYRVTLFSASGAVVFEAELADTVTLIPDSTTLVPGQSYLWKVEARTSWERWTSSELTEFQLRPAGRSEFPSTSPFRFVSLAAAPAAGDSLHVLARRLSDSALVVEVRARPLELRESLNTTLTRVMRVSTPSREAELLIAGRLASAYAAAWSDSFLVREVARFTAWSPGLRQAKVRADSMRRAGIVSFSRDGAEAAIVIWRRALSAFNNIPDTAGIAATLGNIGAGLAYVGRPDSAEQYLERARRFSVAIGDQRVAANAISELAGISETRGDYTSAQTGYESAITLRKRIGDTRGVASDYNNLGGLARTRGDVPAARSYLGAALAINRAEGRDEVAATNLVNLAGLMSVAGELGSARSMYREALTTWRAAERWAEVADALRGMGDLEIRRGDYVAARANLREALEIYERTGPVASEIEVRGVLASVRAAQGELQSAVDELRRATRLADSAKAPLSTRAGIALASADLAAQLNLRSQADRHYERARILFRRSGDRGGEAEALAGRGSLLLRQGNDSGAERMLTTALQTQVAARLLRNAAITRLSLAEVALRKGDTTLARRHLSRAADEFHTLGDRVASGAALGERANLESLHSPAVAESLFRAAIATVGDRIAPDVTWRLHAGLGRVRRSQGLLDDAARELRVGIADIERSGRSLALPERRSSFLTDKWAVYVELAQLERERGRTAASFDVSERLRASEMLGMLSRGRVGEPTDTAAELIAREQDLRYRIAELTRGLGTDTGSAATLRGPDVASTGAATRDALLEAQEAYSELMLEVRERAPRHEALVSRVTASWREVARRLAPDEAFIEFLVSDSASVAFVITRDTLLAVRLGADRHALTRTIEFARGTMQPRGTLRLDSLWRAPLRRLHSELMAPVEASGALRRKTKVIIVPHAELHYVPFAALLSGQGEERFLIEQYQVAVAPSASVWIALGDRRRARATAGTIAFAPRPSALPASRREVAAITRLDSGDTRTLVGLAATESAFRREAPSHRVIHLATYGILNKQNPLFSFVELAPSGADDGRLEAHEVFALRLVADLVVLSACQTGLAAGALGDVPEGDDWIGLARAFLSAGAGRVVASLWPVQDRATAELMERFYERYAQSSDAGAALASAQRSMIASSTTSSPYFWAGFELVGGR